VSNEAIVGKFATITIASCVLLVLGTSALFLAPGARSWLMRHERYSIGDHIDLPDILSDQESISLLVFSRHDCGACQEAKTSLADLVRVVRADASVRIRLVTGTARAEENRRFARDIGVQPEELISIDWDSVRVDSVPFVLVVDRGGIVRYAHQGTPETSQVTAVIAKSGT
jgi:hypothetical protein